MKNILIVAAMPEELDGLFAFFGEVEKMEDGFYKIQENETLLYCMLGGIGKVAMAFKLGTYLAKYKIDEIINVGVAGSVNKKLLAFDTLIADRVCYHDVDLLAFGYKKGQMSGCPLYFECDKEKLKKIESFKDETMKTGLILSGDSFITKENQPKDLFTAFDDPYAIDMESGAVAQVSHIAQIPFLIIRTISDDTNNEDGNKDQYEANMKKAALKAGEIVSQLIKLA